MTKVTYKKKHLIGGLIIVSEDKPMTIMVGHNGSWQPGMVQEQELRAYILIHSQQVYIV